MKPVVLDDVEWVAIGEQLRQVSPALFLRLVERMQAVIAAQRDADRTGRALFCTATPENYSFLKKVS